MTASLTGPSTTFESENDDTTYATSERTGLHSRVPPKSSSGTKSGSSFTVLSVVSSYAALIALVLAQLGYTMVLAVESTFGISRDSLLGDWSHIVSLGAPLLLKIVTSAAEELGDLQFYRRVLQVHGWMFVALLILVFALLRFSKPMRRSASLSVDARRLWIGFGIVSLGTIGVIPTVFALTVMFALPTVAAPMLGLGAAKALLYEYVIKPEHCLPVQNLAERRLVHSVPTPQTKGTAVVCVAVSKEGKEQHSGRVVLSDSKYVVLYNPDTGVTRKVDTEGAVIEAVAELR